MGGNSLLDLYEELKTVAVAVNASGKPYALIGGLAVSLHANPRATEDIDILVLPEHLPSIARSLAPRGYLPTGNPMPFAGCSVTIQRFSKTDGRDLIILDLLLASDEEMRGALVRSIQLEIDGNPVKVAASDDLVRLKRRRNSLQDLADLSALTGAEDER